MEVSAVPEQSSINKLFSDPNFISLLAGVGQRLDPQGVGGALGGATIDYQKATAAQEAAKALVARNAPPTQSPLTPAGVPGPTSETTTRNADGTYSTTVKGDSPPSTATPIAPAGTAVPPVVESPITPAAPVAPTSAAPQATSRTQMSQLPFSLAPTQGQLDFRGLSAEQIPQILQAYHEGERLRQSNVGQILAAYDQDSTIAAREAASSVNRETAAHLARIAPYDVRKVVAEIRERELVGDVKKLEADRLTETAHLNLPMAKQELARAIAGTEAQRASAASSYASSRASDESTARSAQLREQEKTTFDQSAAARAAQALTYDVPGVIPGQTVKITADKMPQFLSQLATNAETKRQHDTTTRSQALSHSEHAATLAAAQQKSETDRLNDATAAEFTLLEPKDAKGNSIKAQTAAPQADVFNMHSLKPYVYIYFPDEPGTKVGSLVGMGERHPQYSDKNAAVPIPQMDRSKFPDMPRNAREVYALATSMGVTVQRVIEIMYDRGFNDPSTLPKDRVKAPWLQ